MEDLTVSYGRIRQQTRFDATGTAIEEVVVPIHIGAHGPFTERFTLAEYSDGVSLPARIAKLKTALQTLPR